MKNHSSIKFRLPKGLLYALLGFFIFSAVPSSSSSERAPVKTEQRDVARSSSRSFSLIKFYSSVSSTKLHSDEAFLSSLLSQTTSINVRFKNQINQALMFKPIGIVLISLFHSRIDEYSSISNNG